MPAIVDVAALIPSTQVPLHQGINLLTTCANFRRHSAMQRVKNAHIKRISSGDLMCHDVFIPLKTLVGAYTVSKYACQRERSF
jgi:hypothetical protein